MRSMQSLGAKITGAVSFVVAIAFAVNFFMSSSTNATLKKASDNMIESMRASSDMQKNDLLKNQTERLKLEEDKINLAHKFSMQKMTANINREINILEGTRQGISTTVAALVKAAMLAGDAETVQNMIETLTEEEGIASVKLWRSTGELAFLDNQTLDDVNARTGASFARRKSEPAVRIEGERAAALARAVKTGRDDIVIQGEVKGVKGTVPVNFSYFVLQNEEECQACHGQTKVPRGVIELAVSRADLIKVKDKADQEISMLTMRQKKELNSLEDRNAALRTQEKKRFQEYSKKMENAQVMLDKTRGRVSWISALTELTAFVVTLGVLILLLRRLLVCPLRKMTTAMNALSQGDLATKIPETERHDELGEMAASVQVFKDNMVETQRLTEEQSFEQQAREARMMRRDKETSTFDEQVSQMLQAVSDATKDLELAANTMSHNVEQTSEQSGNAANAAQNASQNVQTVAAAADELSKSIVEIGAQVAKSTETASSAVHEAERTNQEIEGLAQAANKIGEVVSIITDIAEQTNLLALNATIEAARAGDAGKGFAVVASEVKNLAMQTSKATEEIAGQISGIQGATESAVQAIRGIGATIDQMNEITATIAAAVEEQGAATREIANNVDQASMGTDEVSSHINEVNKVAAETGEASNAVLMTSKTLAELSVTLRAQVDTFLNAVKED